MSLIKLFNTVLIAVLLSAPIYAESTAQPNAGDIIIKEGEVIVTSHDVDMLFLDMSQSQKERILSDKVKLRNLLLDLIVLRKQTHEARKKKLHDNDFYRWKTSHSNNQLLSNMLLNDYKENIVIPDSIELLAKEYYNSNPSKFTSKEQVKASHILFSTSLSKIDNESNKDNKLSTKKDKLELAKQILKELKDGLDFAKAVEKYSDDEYSQKKEGDLGYFTRGKMVKKFEDAAFNLKENLELSPIIETQFGYHIIKRTDYIPKTISSFAEVKDKLILQEKKKYLAEKTTQYTDSFNEDPKKLKFSVSIFNKAFDKNKTKYLKMAKPAINE